MPGWHRRERRLLVIGDILPDTVTAVESFGDAAGDVLFPEERAYIAKAVGKRRREFTTGRACARAALAGLGLPPAPILPGPRGEPQWPPGIVGSITHCAGYRAGAVARDRDLLALGVDAEPNQQIPASVLERVATPGESALLPGLRAAAPAVRWDRLLFCAKEAVYKAWSPLTGRWLDFEEVSVGFGEASAGAGAATAAGTFSARLLVPGPVAGGRTLTGFSGRWLAAGGLLLAAVAVPALDQAPPVPAHDQASARIRANDSR
jgi:4'-phosphopantetheinyl transferase EntD